MSSEPIGAGVGPDSLVVARFESQARAAGSRIAVTDGPLELTYQELNWQANQLAGWLRQRGVGPEDVIGVHFVRSWRLVVTALAVLKAGAAYLPIDPANPPGRVGSMLTRAGARLVLCGTEHLAVLRDQLNLVGATAEPVPVDRLDLAGQPAGDPPPVVSPANLAYLVYTSGSTGEPTGVMVSHGALAQLLDSVGAAYRFGPADRTGLACSPSFDVSVSELWLPLCAGASIDVPEPVALLSPAATIDWLVTREITATVLPTPVAERALRHPWPTRLALHTLLTGGDRLHEWPDPALPFRLINNYGPTEHTVIATMGVVPARPAAGEPALPTIGHPVAGTVVELLDEQLAPATQGELYLGGPQLARGYVGQPGLTAQRFVPHPRPRFPGERLYRTGDLARRLPTGELEFIGRRDDQIKLRGHRIELAEVTAALTSHPEVAAGYVTVRGTGEAAQLVAYLVAVNPQRLPPASGLRRHLAGRLPAYMVPAAFVTLPALPLTTNGKVDRAALPEPGREARATAHTYQPPRAGTEQQVAQVWQEVLRVDRVGATDSFFDLGGHSLLATQIVGRLGDQFGIELPMAELFAAGNVADLATAIDARRGRVAPAGLPPVRPDTGALTGPLSLPQQQVWFLDRLAPGNAAYHAQATIRVAGEFSPEVFHRALTELTRRHESLRTVYQEVDGQPVARVQPPAPYPPLRQVDLSAAPADARRQRLAEAVRAELARPFDLSQLPLQRWTVLRLATDEHELVMVEHHLVHDGWSFAVLMRELEALYTAFARDEPAPLPPPAVQFRDYVHWQQQLLASPIIDDQLAYWREQLAGAGVLSLPTDHPRPHQQSHRGTVLRLELPSGLPAAIRRCGRAEGASEFMLMYAAFVALLHRYTGDTDICVASGYANRRRPETEDLIGMLVNMVVLRSQLTGHTRFRELLAQSRQRVLAAADHQECPFPLVVKALGHPRDPSRNPLAQVMFSAHDSAVRHPQFGAATGTVFERSNDTAKVDLNVVMVPRTHQQLGSREHTDERITLLWEYNRDLFAPATMQAMAQAYLRLLAAAVAAPDTPVARLPVLDERTTRTVLVDWNRSVDAAVPRSGDSVAAQVAAQARRQPAALAVADADGELTYQQLHQRSQRLAGELVAAGFGSGVLVAVCLPRSAALVVAELAVLAAGSAFLPIDPANPDQRLRGLLGSSGARLVITSGELAARLATAGPLVWLVDRPAADVPAAGDDPPLAVPQPGPDDLAYVMYTSGSTGTPKGVLVTQHSFANLVGWHRDRLRLRPGDRTTMVASPGFDFSVWECWPTLTAGGSLHLPPAETLLAPADLREWLREQRLTVASLPTPLAESLLSLSGPLTAAGGPLRALVAGGDRLTVRPPTDLGVEVLNVYGPTENTVVSTGGPVGPAGTDDRLPDIGTPIPGTTAYILDTALNPVPPGVMGELYLGGVGVARGYLDRPDLTADRFVPDPFALPGARLYRTGDLARHRLDGTIEFIGRTDDQVKIRGHRLEPAEVTAALRRHHAVRDAFVTVRTDRGHPELVAYLVPAGATTPEPARLREQLAEQLPAPLLPAAYVFLPELPLTRHGKVDRRALPAPTRDRSAPAVAAGTERERMLVEIWREVLRVERVGVTDSFFDLGGHSLLLGQVQRRLEQRLAEPVPLVTLFAYPTIRALAGQLGRADGEPVQAAPTDGSVTTSAAQEPGQRQRGGRDRLRRRANQLGNQ